MALNIHVVLSWIVLMSTKVKGLDEGCPQPLDSLSICTEGFWRNLTQGIKIYNISILKHLNLNETDVSNCSILFGHCIGFSYYFHLKAIDFSGLI